MIDGYNKLYNEFKEWNYGIGFNENHVISSGFDYVKFLKWDLMKVTSYTWMDKRSYEGNNSKYLHLMKYDKDLKTKVLRDIHINNLL